MCLSDFHSFCFRDLETVTNNFDARPESAGGNKLGEGGFGIVFKGYISGRNVAVKKLIAVSYPGYFLFNDCVLYSIDLFICGKCSVIQLKVSPC